MDTTIKNQLWKLHLAFGLAILTSFCRAFRFPNPWSTAHWMITYEYGLVKRGLIGALVAPILEGRSQAQIQTAIDLMATATTLIWIGAMIWIASSIIKQCRDPLPAALAIIAILMGPYTIMMAHINGYYDAIAFVLSIVACVCIKKGNPFLAGCVLAISTLCHETTLFYGAPAVAVAIVAKYYIEGEWPCWKRLIQCGIPLGTTFGIVLLVRNHQTDNLLPQLLEHLKVMGFSHGHYQMVPHAIVGAFEDPWAIMYPQILRILSSPPYPVQIGIPALALIAVSASQFPRKIRGSMTALIALATFLPLAIHAIAWDTSRIWTYPLGNGVLILWAACQFGTEKSREGNNWITGLSLLAIGIAIASQTPLMDNLVTRGTWQTALMGYIPALALLVWAFPTLKNPQEKV